MRKKPHSHRIPTALRQINEAAARLLEDYSLDEITVVQLCEEAGVNRQTFYYHYDGLFDVAKTIVLEAMQHELYRYAQYANWQAGFLALARYLDANERLLVHVYKTSYRTALRDYVCESFATFSERIVDERRIRLDLHIAENDRAFVIRTYSLLFCSVLYDWILQSPRSTPEALLRQFMTFIGGSLDPILRRFDQLGEEPVRVDIFGRHLTMPRSER